MPSRYPHTFRFVPCKHAAHNVGIRMSGFPILCGNPSPARYRLPVGEHGRVVAIFPRFSDYTTENMEDQQPAIQAGTFLRLPFLKRRPPVAVHATLTAPAQCHARSAHHSKGLSRLRCNAPSRRPRWENAHASDENASVSTDCPCRAAALDCVPPRTLSTFPASAAGAPPCPCRFPPHPSGSPSFRKELPVFPGCHLLRFVVCLFTLTEKSRTLQPVTTWARIYSLFPLCTSRRSVERSAVGAECRI